MLGLLGILIAALNVEFNDLVTTDALPDVTGGLAFGRDQGTWITSLFAAGQLIGMPQATWWAVTLSVRRFALVAIALSLATSVATALSTAPLLVCAMRFVGGLAAGFTIPLLLMVALQVLKPETRLFGFALYALTATFGPNVAPALAALWPEGPGWRFVFLQDIPLCALSAALVAIGLPRQPIRRERLALFDWTGTLLVVASFGSTATVLEQGDRLDWFASPLIRELSVVAVAATALLAINEAVVPSPLFKLYLLGRRNVVYALTALFAFLVINLSATTLPVTFLEQIAGFRPLQAFGATAIIAAAQLAALPAAALLLDRRRVDSRLVSLCGIGCLIAACIGDSRLTPEWQTNQFLVFQGLQAIGGPLIMVSLLMMATNAIRKPEDGLYGSTLVNTTRALAEPVGVWLIQLVARWRGGLHTSRLTDQAAQVTTGYAAAAPPSDPGLARAIALQASVLTFADTFLVLAAIAAALIVVLALVPTRTYPPRILFGAK